MKDQCDDWRKNPSVEELNKLWQMVVVQDSARDKAEFVGNWLRGIIKIPDEVFIRKNEADTQASR